MNSQEPFDIGDYLLEARIVENTTAAGLTVQKLDELGRGTFAWLVSPETTASYSSSRDRTRWAASAMCYCWKESRKR